MKQKLIPKPNLQVKKKFNATQNQSLQVLSYTNDEILTYLNETATQNPFLQYRVPNSEIDSDAYLAYAHTQDSIYDVLIQQARVSKYEPSEEICEYLISQLDSNGYFKKNYAQILKGCPYPAPIVKHTIAILRTFEPYGLFAFSLKECLQIQCKLANHPVKENAFLLCDYLEELALQRFEMIAQKTGLSLIHIRKAYQLIQTLNPKPAANYAQNAMYMRPEFKITVDNNTIGIQLLNDDLEISFACDEMNESKEMQAYIKRKRQEVTMLMRTIKKRNVTLLQMMQAICDVQKDFFLNHKPLQHLTLAMIADACSLHISTISRAIQNKSCEFESHYYSLKHFLSSGGSEDFSIQAIKDKIIEYIENEDKTKHYSDETLKQLLHEEGIDISRRAVSKYREACYIFNSIKRKRAKT